ncbi:hypothetical protein C6963_27790, partial [Escherichia coli]|uniref:FixH family protein n=1 Tax=Escherichia coli TaxID=562 RepID=UPI000D44C66E
YMVWVFVIALPLLMVALCVILVVYSVREQDSVVRDDWYMDGKTLYADVSKDKLAHDLGLTGQLNLHTPDATFVLNVPAGSTFVRPQTLMVQIYMVWVFVIALPLLMVALCVILVVYSVREQDSVV